MKIGRDLQSIAKEINRQRDAKVDLIAQTSAIHMGLAQVQEGEVVGSQQLHIGEYSFGINETGHDQLGTYLKIPSIYYDRMRKEVPELLTKSVNTWLSVKDEPRMIRTLDGNVRAVLSDRYRPLENAELAQAILPTLLRLNLEIISAEITERRLYIKAVDKRISKDIPTGKKMGDASHTFFDTCSPAIVISNSEIGYGALSVETGIWTKVCTNLCIAGQRSMRKYHLGAKQEFTDSVTALLSDETRRVTDQALWLQTRDVVKAAFDQAKFDALISEVQGMTEQPIKGNPVKVVELSSKRFGINGEEQNSVLRHLIEGGDLSRYGLFNAITRTAEDLPSYDRATDFERIGGQVIELNKTEWEQLAEAA